MKSGIYKILNKINQKSYIGSSISVNDRKNCHFSNLRRNKHTNKFLQNAWNKYGENNFEFIVLEMCDKSKLFIKEQEYVNINNPEYNIRVVVQSNFGIKLSPEFCEKQRLNKLGKKLGPHSKERREATSKRNKGYKHTQEVKDFISKLHKGRIVSSSTREKLSKSLSGIKRGPMSEERKEYLRKIHTGRIFSEETKQKMKASAKLRHGKK